MWANFKAFFAQPYTGTNMSALDWFLFLGLVIVLMSLWRVIFMHVEEGI